MRKSNINFNKITLTKTLLEIKSRHIKLKVDKLKALTQKKS